MKKSTLTTVLIIGLSLLFLSAGAFKKTPEKQIGDLPVLKNGRIKAIDTVARNTLLSITEKQSIRIDKEKISALDWWLTLISRPDITDAYPIFPIHHDAIKDFLNIKNPKQKKAAFTELSPILARIEEQAAAAESIEAPLRSTFQKNIIQLYQRLKLYHESKVSLIANKESATSYLDTIETLIKDSEPLIQNPDSIQTPSQQAVLVGLDQLIQEIHYFNYITPIHYFPHRKNGEITWQKTAIEIRDMFKTTTASPLLRQYAQLIDTLANGNSIEKNTQALTHYTKTHFPKILKESRFEALFNRIAPFYKSMVFYVLSLLIILLSFLIKPIKSIAFTLLNIGFFTHTAGLLARMLIQDRPPVTNLYSSAVFVGWGAVLLAIILEKRFKNGLGTLIASLIGFASLIIAHHLSLSGDTLEMMQAVLDSNFWLATHVIVITLGYSATFLAGFLGQVSIVYQWRNTPQHKTTRKDLEKMVFGIICFGLLFSFIGTVLGGIWADQSWGRFWGWDPKENGALLIVLWNAIILHARFAGLIKERGLMVLAMFGNIITAFSWFGVNMLGIGLHSYGFMDKAFWVLVCFSISQLLGMGVAFLPKKHERK